jgi:hypothetical protein
MPESGNNVTEAGPYNTKSLWPDKKPVLTKHIGINYNLFQGLTNRQVLRRQPN